MKCVKACSLALHPESPCPAVAGSLTKDLP